MAEDSTRQGDDMLRPSPNHGTQRLLNDDDDDCGYQTIPEFRSCSYHYVSLYQICCDGLYLSIK